MYLKKMFSDSAKEFQKLRSLTAIAMLVAVQLALNSVDLQLTQELRISFGFLANATIAYLFGPVVAVAGGAMSDILAVILFPKGPYFPGFTMTAIVGGLIYGLFLYRQGKVSYFRALLAKGLVNLICNVGLNTLWLFILYGQSMLALWPARLLKNAVLWPLESLLLFVVIMAIGRVWKSIGKQ